VRPITLPDNCFDVATDQQIAAAAHAKLPGQTRFIKNVAIAKIGRTGRITCSYGYTGAKKPIPIEVSVTAYTTAVKATDRVGVTVRAERMAGATFTDVAIDGVPGTLLVGRTGSLLVYADGQVTVAVSVDAAAHIADSSAVLTAVSTQVHKNLASL
jgi:hypothetical protein